MRSPGEPTPALPLGGAVVSTFSLIRDEAADLATECYDSIDRLQNVATVEQVARCATLIARLAATLEDIN